LKGIEQNKKRRENIGCIRINGEQATVGASDYIVEDQDIIVLEFRWHVTAPHKIFCSKNDLVAMWTTNYLYYVSRLVFPIFT